MTETSMVERPPNNEMIEGFRDGYDLNNPEPSENRSHSYRHGFHVARVDKGMRASTANADQYREMADDAMDRDAALAAPSIAGETKGAE